jgi:hypothetical protein
VRYAGSNIIAYSGHVIMFGANSDSSRMIVSNDGNLSYTE